MKNYEFWFVVGSQTLYGEEVLATVARRAEEMAQKLSAVLPYPLKYKVTAKSSAEITQVVKEANYDDSCAGIVTWCHTFSPSKMWINGLDLLQKPWLHFATQYNREIPNEEIDMDFMNLNQAAHGDREHGFIGARLRKPRKVIAGYWQDEDVQSRIGSWMKAAIGVAVSKGMRSSAGRSTPGQSAIWSRKCTPLQRLKLTRSWTFTARATTLQRITWRPSAIRRARRSR